jgi:hypothetical protein
MTPMPSLSKVCRKVAEYLASRSTMRKRLSRDAPDSTSIRFRETCGIQMSFGLGVMPHTVTRRVERSMACWVVTGSGLTHYGAGLFIGCVTVTWEPAW